MSLFVFDTDTLSLFRGGHPEVVRRVLACPPRQRAVTIITVEEILSGWYALVRKAKTPEQTEAAYERLASAVELLGTLRVLRLTVAAVERFEALKVQRLNIGAMDLRIAAIALEHDATVVTRNRRDYDRVPELRIEDWSLEEEPVTKIGQTP
jgi:tRNA(fMet)-specific endonuclease VapC